MNERRECKRIEVRGHVQGVFFRASAQAEARRLGVDGWVRNRDDGSVALLAAGSPIALAELAAWCRGGPPRARVDEVRIETTPEPPDLPRPFAVRYG